MTVEDFLALDREQLDQKNVELESISLSISVDEIYADVVLSVTAPLKRLIK
jgi:hypothetical protein